MPVSASSLAVAAVVDTCVRMKSEPHILSAGLACTLSVGAAVFKEGACRGITMTVPTVACPATTALRATLVSACFEAAFLLTISEIHFGVCADQCLAT